MDDIFKKPYNHKEHEKEIYSLWEKNKDFSPKGGESFCILMPPPNVTGVLHIGHALEQTLIDTRIRYERIKGKKALLVPGTDHAAIATQSRVEKDIQEKEGIKNVREHYGREKLVEKIREYADNAKETILTQIKCMGTSCDWDRLAYTFDEKRSKTVREIFKALYDDKVIYKGPRIINWDPRLQTTVSDDEILRKEETSTLYYLKYGPFTIATVRPETKFGDKYVVMNPKDERYLKYKHKDKIKVEWINGEVEATIIKDDAVDMEFGTGVMTITPYHDHTDFEIAERHNLDKEQIIDWKGKLLKISKEFEGMHIQKARPLIVEKLREKQLIEKEDKEYKHNIQVSERSGEIIEPQIKEQWFISVTKKIERIGKSLNDLQKEAVEKEIKIYPKRFEKIYFEWINNPKDWCISRQIWWGHRIPVWYRGEEVHCGDDPGEGWTQDEDTLDTWFSSGTWSFSTLQGEDRETFHPTNWIQMGHEILFLWMARMILMSKYMLNEIPFKEVYIHGLLRDKDGRKFSKSLRNGIDPMEVIEEYGADALRFGLLIGVTPGNDIRFEYERIKHAKHFMNKVWNISRFVLENIEGIDLEKNIEGKREKEILEEAEKTAENVSKYLDESKFNLAAEEVHSYVWHTFADKVIEESKKEGEERKRALYFTLIKILIMIHPFAPFITEVIWQRLPKKPSERLINHRLS